MELLLDPENVDAPAPETRITAADLHAQAVESIEGLAEERAQDGDVWPETAAEYGYPLDPRAPRQRVFYPIADKLLGGRKRGAHGSALAYTILDPSTRQEVTMNLQRDRLAATGTDGAVLNLAAHGARRR